MRPRTSTTPPGPSLSVGSPTSSDVSDDDRAADDVVPAALARVERDPDHADVDTGESHKQADEAQNSLAPCDLAAVGVTDNIETEQHHSDCLTRRAPQGDEIDAEDGSANPRPGRSED